MDQLNAQTVSRRRFADSPDRDAVFAAEYRRAGPPLNAVRADVFDGALDAEQEYWPGFISADGSAAYRA